jgi:hypothetical protein
MPSHIIKLRISPFVDADICVEIIDFKDVNGAASTTYPPPSDSTVIVHSAETITFQSPQAFQFLPSNPADWTFGTNYGPKWYDSGKQQWCAVFSKANQDPTHQNKTQYVLDLTVYKPANTESYNAYYRIVGVDQVPPEFGDDFKRPLSEGREKRAERILSYLARSTIIVSS